MNKLKNKVPDVRIVQEIRGGEITEYVKFNFCSLPKGEGADFIRAHAKDPEFLKFMVQVTKQYIKEGQAKGNDKLEIVVRDYLEDEPEPKRDTHTQAQTQQRKS